MLGRHYWRERLTDKARQKESMRIFGLDECYAAVWCGRLVQDVLVAWMREKTGDKAILVDSCTAVMIRTAKGRLKGTNYDSRWKSTL